MRNWMSNVSAEPGFQLNVLQALAKLKEEEKDCSLIFDSMTVKHEIQWNEHNHSYSGFSNCGNNTSFGKKKVEAQEAVVFLLVSVKGIWKWPIAYFLVKKMSSTMLSEFLKTALILCSENKLRVHSLTFDGDASNCSAINKLGAQIFAPNYKDIKHYFSYVSDGKEHVVRVILDPCHMLKLARNALAKYKEIVSPEGIIKWDYIVKLHLLQKQITLKLKNKLSSHCINWYQNKMKVKYAAQTLSSSVANAIEFLKNKGLEEFKDSSATIQFIRKIDRIFDFLNSRNPFGKGFKKPIFKQDIEHLKYMVDEIIQYLFSLKTIDGQPLHSPTLKRVFIYGLSIAALSILDICSDIFKNNQSFKYILTYKFSQDHLEIFFSKIRARHGFNNNPTCDQFRYAMRQLLLHADIKQTINANCFEFDTEYVTSIYPLMWKDKKKQDSLEL
ncbi:THAP domain-containing protein 9 [Trachymyrmex cornetzi]|uniref:THAP domain-containing protein 9 n=1 Tax=Trachymyrmex cornetzi TaxID=471704 RepID=A0A151JLH8_9HYME|nr:THAP domain-containing protein 9 [Trachymyrmex cornetzi]